MNGFITTNRFARIVDLPLSFAQTELKSGKSIIIAQIPLLINQRLEFRTLTLSIIGILTPGVVPAYLNTAMGLCSVGVFRGTITTGPITFASFTDQSVTTNPFACCVVETPGTYNVIVSNNSSNTDLAVAVTGSAKLYY